MRLPSINDLTRKQKAVYFYAPVDQHVLVYGPPGTGKTLIACLRAKELQEKKRRLVLAMFNRVLKKYTSNVAEARQVPVDTLIRWFRKWWYECGLPPHPDFLVYLDVPYQEREQAKALGATWKPEAWPGRRTKGSWAVDYDTWDRNRASFERWRARCPVPPDPEDRKGIGPHWEFMATHALENDEDLEDEALELGTLLIDEGQDFPPGLYRFLRILCAAASSRKDLSHPPRCFVLADENQQLTSSNSTLDEIKNALRIQPEHTYLLNENFRNTRQVATLAASFYADVVTGLPLPPDREGEIPQYVATASPVEALQFIERWVRNNPGLEVGVFTFLDPKRQALYEGLKERLEGLRGRDQIVQTYASNDPELRKVDSLQFDREDTLTVLNVQSCKGLEFDAVFVVDLADGYGNPGARDRFRMQMFVATSRARTWVCLLDQRKPPAGALHLAELPGPEVLERGDGSVPAPPPPTGPDRVTAQIIRLGFAPKSLLSQLPVAFVAYTPDRRRVAVLHEGRWETNGNLWFEVRDDDVVFEAPTPSSSPPARKPPAPKGPATPGAPQDRSGAGDWVAEAIRVAESARAKWSDKRAHGGCFWIHGPRDLGVHLKPLGFHYKEGKGWWRK